MTLAVQVETLWTAPLATPRWTLHHPPAPRDAAHGAWGTVQCPEDSWSFWCR
jgi:hypothetical protein